MGTWHDYLKSEGTPPEWPYPIKFGEEKEVETDVLVLGGGIAGCWAAITAARNGAKVVLLEKGDVRRSGAGGPGCDHWCNVPANPLSRVDPDWWAEQMTQGPFSNGIGTEIQCREDFDTLLEMEQMGGKIRDTDDEFVGIEGRDPETKFCVSPRYGVGVGYAPYDDWKKPGYNPPEKRTNVVLRIWGSTFKPILKKECKKLGVQVFDRVMATSLLNEGGKQGARIVGATGLNVRTGEFIIVKAKAVVMSAAGPNSLWFMDMEHGGYSTMYSRNECGDATAMAFNAGAKITMMEGSAPYRIASGLKHKWYTGGNDASYENVPLVDANNTKLPAPTQGWADGGAMFSNQANIINEIREGVKEGKYELPFFGDFAGMKPEEANATWNLMLNEESTTKVMVKTMTENGFDYKRDQIMNYTLIEFQPSQQYRDGSRSGGLMIDWDLMTNVPGLFGAGTSIFSPGDHSFAASTGRYAGRKAAAYAKAHGAADLCREQVDKEKDRVLAPTKRDGGIEWKELHNGVNRVMQYFVSEFKSEKLLDIALEEIERIEENAVPQLYALDPHKLMRSIEDLSIITCCKVAIYAMKERRLTNARLRIDRVDYPQDNPEEANCFLTLRLENDEVKFERVPSKWYGNMKEGYEAHNKDYTGVYKPAE
ncbi:MAG: FAD-dependent oxidoreductase [Oscillospiraceae bacterium]|nr:FAD-dependent oxidoreductase [Oscillospiraceae bacterium]